MNYYNEIDPYAASWLRELVLEGLIPAGVVDERSILDVAANDVAGYDQCHFFAGIGGWSLALRLAGWPEDRPVWTGSCPCQPFSVAGKRGGTADKRHLWPEFSRLIARCAPTVIFGEQVASKDGRGWLNGVRAGLEALDYGVVAADLCAAGVGAPHVRQRLYWMADKVPVGLVYADCAEASRLRRERIPMESKQETRRPSDATAWSDFEVVGCADGKERRFESGFFPLAHGVSARLGRLRGYGNAIVPQVAAEFIKACGTP